ncbi:MAG: peptidoglycan bridge formation glycyltransferase FemA/FemB family protein [Patescibacteria group bacterium]|nr:peptidoglycan bridge formation glycyltransferase FemA/FemB family protein [Patescibacteria group bacterium]
MQVFEIFERTAYDKFLLNHGGPLLQSFEWGEFQKKMGRKVWRLQVSTNVGKVLAAATVLKMPLPRGLSYFYCPRGPVLAQSVNAEKVWGLILDKLSDLTIGERPIFFRVDPEISVADNWFSPTSAGFKKISWEIQPQATRVLDLTLSEGQLLHQAKPKTRYNIHLAQKKGVSVMEYRNGSQVKVFWDLMKSTTTRDRFSAHPYLYYFNLMEVLGKAGQAGLFVASYQRRPLAAAIIGSFAGRTIYLHGASSDRMRSAMAPYLVQWSAILSAKARGDRVYDFGGIAPAGAGSNHPWAGITRFKNGFGGSELAYLGAYDLVYNSLWYQLYRFARQLNRFRIL